MQDKAYQQYRKEFAQNAAMARDTSRNTANQLSGGYNPTYADTVANEVYNERMGNINFLFAVYAQFAHLTLFLPDC